MKLYAEIKPNLVLILAVLILFSMLVPSGKLLLTLALLPLAVLDMKKALFVLIALFLIKMTNTAIVGADPYTATAAWITSLAASTRLWLEIAVNDRHVKMYQPKILPLLALFVLVLLAISAFSLSPMISVMKACVFFYIAGAILVATTRNASAKSSTLSWLHASWVSVVAVSLLTLAIPELGYFRDGQGFQGVLNHPQGLAVFAAPFLAWLMGKTLTEKKVPFSIALVLVVVVCILFLTKARTALASILLGAALLGILRAGMFVKWLKWIKQIVRRKLSLILIPFVIVAIPKVYADFEVEINEYMFKTSASNELSESFEMSRGFLILQAIENFKNNPVTGIGFGVSYSETHEFNVDVDPVTGAPIGAATEKANLAIAVIEETGLVGASFFVIFFIVFLRAIANGDNAAIAWAALTAVCTNISEMTFFSMNGLGTYIWMICGLAIVQNYSTAAAYKK